MDVQRIKLEKLTNTRDLGGFPAADGKRIRPRRLIRSGELKKATDRDLETLTGRFGVHTVVDLRTQAEREQSPDPALGNVNSVWLPVLDSSFFGIARDEDSVQAWLKLFRDESRVPKEIFCEMYRKLMFSDYVKPYYRTFFDTLLSNEQGAVLWHCSAGKDRAGVATLLIGMALGVPREELIADYLMTETFSKKELRKLRLIIPLRVREPRVRTCLYVLLSVDRRYVSGLFDLIDERFGSEEGYLKQFIGLTDPELTRLRELYLEKGSES